MCQLTHNAVTVSMTLGQSTEWHETHACFAAPLLVCGEVQVVYLTVLQACFYSVV